MNDHPLEKDYVRQLMNQMVDRFVTLPRFCSEAICEVVLLGPFLDKERYRVILSQFLDELKTKTVLDTYLLQGLVMLIEHAPPFHLQADDLTKILRIVRDHLTDSAQQDSAKAIQLTVAISKILVIMVDCGVKDLQREQEHKPLLEILSELRQHKEPLVRNQVEYAYGALQLIPDDETMREKLTRNGLGLTAGLIKMSGALKLDFNEVPDNVPEVWNNGRELVANLRQYFGSENKNRWFLAVRQAEVMVSEGQLVAFNQLICKDECHLDPLFQWNVCLIQPGYSLRPV